MNLIRTNKLFEDIFARGGGGPLLKLGNIFQGNFSCSPCSLSFHFQQLFRPSIKDYDILIELDKNHVPKLPFIQSSKSVHKSSDVRLASMVSNNISNEILPVVDFDPVRSFLHQLQVSFFIYIKNQLAMHIRMAAEWFSFLDGINIYQMFILSVLNISTLLIKHI